jgi:hypothetical protein
MFRLYIEDRRALASTALGGCPARKEKKEANAE